jgi:hypothetical protein
MSEVDSFIGKFKCLWHSGRSASLTINSEAGKAKVTLSVEIDDAPHLPAQSQQKSRNGPARQRHRLRREEARKNARAEEASKSLDAENFAAEEVVNVRKMSAVENVDKSIPENASNEQQQEVEKTSEANENADCDAYNFDVVDFATESEAQDMINYFEEKSAIAFELFNVDKQV